MKKIEAIVEPFKLNAVKEALQRLGITVLTVSEVRGFAGHHAHSEIYRGSEYLVDLLPKLKIEVVLEDDVLDYAVEAIHKYAKTAKGGPGMFVSLIADATLMPTD